MDTITCNILLLLGCIIELLLLFVKYPLRIRRDQICRNLIKGIPWQLVRPIISCQKLQLNSSPRCSVVVCVKNMLTSSLAY